MSKEKLIAEGFEAERKSATKGFWQCLAVSLALLLLTVISYVRPDWVQVALGTVTAGAFIFTGVAAQVAWETRRKGRFF